MIPSIYNIQKKSGVYGKSSLKTLLYHHTSVKQNACERHGKGFVRQKAARRQPANKVPCYATAYDNRAPKPLHESDHYQGNITRLSKSQYPARKIIGACAVPHRHIF